VVVPEGVPPAEELTDGAIVRVEVAVDVKVCVPVPDAEDPGEAVEVTDPARERVRVAVAVRLPIADRLVVEVPLAEIVRLRDPVVVGLREIPARVRVAVTVGVGNAAARVRVAVTVGVGSAAARVRVAVTVGVGKATTLERLGVVIGDCPLVIANKVTNSFSNRIYYSQGNYE